MSEFIIYKNQDVEYFITKNYYYKDAFGFLGVKLQKREIDKNLQIEQRKKYVEAIEKKEYVPIFNPYITTTFFSIRLNWFLEWYRVIKSKIKGWWLRKNNTTAKDALKFLTNCADEKNCRCPDCRQLFIGEYLFIDHCEKVHGYPRDMDVTRYYESGSVGTCEPAVKKASSEYMKYL